ncbi:MAG: DNA repair protein RecN [Acutalibacteraceae bacterium]|nr:DNA repair protein RecN [Acutalibacteraceae bacterium]
MLKSLHIENIAVIEKTDIDISRGFNVLTGETGAGKSIIIDSINAVLGERTSKELIRFGCNKAEVTALFCDISDSSRKILEENGYSPDEDGNLLIMRVLNAMGNGSIKINGKPATAGVLKIIGKSLVNIHGQHDNQSLLDPDTHYIYIDRIAENEKELNSYYDEFKRLNAIRRELNSIETDEGEKRRKLDLLDYQINELESAQIRVGELLEIKEKLQIAENYEKTASALTEADFCISGDDDSLGAAALLRNATRYVSSTQNSIFDSANQKLLEAIALLEDAGSDIRHFINSTEYSEADCENLRARLDTLNRLMLKYGNGEQEMLEFLDKAQTERDKIMLSDEKIKELSRELDLSTERLIVLGDKLTASRKNAAKKFAKNVTEQLQLLDMQNATFDVSFRKGRYTKVGCDEIEFIICTNVGEDAKPLHKIASGGELSRVMLSLKSVLADKDDVDTLIFDEIDSGISGRAADKVGIQLKSVSRCGQVICVTHLAQIAAYADNHLFIKKQTQNERTYTHVEPLSYDQRIHEIARIMSGTDITENLYNSAKELLDRSSSI